MTSHRRRPANSLLRAAMIAWVVSSTAAAVPARAEDYHLAPMDKLRLRIAEWQSATGALRDWGLLNGDYVVGPSGAISIPLLGEIEADGRTTKDIAETIGTRLQEKFGLSDRPEAALEVTEFRPLYVLGDVQAPGAFPYAPGLTVIKAISLSGGERRAISDGLRSEREVVQIKGGRDVFVAERNRLLARKARIATELAGRADIEVPAELKTVPGYEGLIADEGAILAAETQRVELQLKALEDLKRLLESEVVTLGEKRVSLERQRKLFGDELKTINRLADRGLVVNTRVSDLQRSASDIETQLLDLDTATLRAKQDISKAEQDAITLRNDREATLAADRQKVDAELAAVRLKIGTQDDLAGEALSIDPSAASLRNERSVTYSITRTQDAKTTTSVVDANTEVKPGDVVNVLIEKPKSSGF